MAGTPGAQHLNIHHQYKKSYFTTGGFLDEPVAPKAEAPKAEAPKAE